MGSKDLKEKSFGTKTAGILQQISIGKYDRGLYLDEKRHQSSICGGIFTILIVVTILTYMISVFSTIFNRLEYKVEESSVIFKDSGIGNLTFGQISDQMPSNFEIDLSGAFGYTNCTDVKFTV